MVFDDQGNVVLALAQRRHGDREHVQAKQEVTAEASLPYRLVEVAVGGGDHACVGLQRLGASHSLELALLQHTEECDLKRRRQLADLVEEDCPSAGERSAPYAAPRPP
jgi:hypothetical protein